MSVNLIRPTPLMAEWADREFGLIIHADLQIFDDRYTHSEQARGEVLDPYIFNPMELDTDQWVKAAVDAGAKYAVLVAKHCSGYCLWPTKVHDFCIRTSKWTDGKGDIVGDFFKSCEKYDIKPGLYYSASRNAYCKAWAGRVLESSPYTQEEYNDIVIRQLTELWTW